MGNICSTSFANGDADDGSLSNSAPSSPACCRRRRRSKKSRHHQDRSSADATLAKLQQQSESIFGNGNNGGRTDSGSDHHQQQQQHAHQRFHCDPREEPSLASVDSDLMTPALTHPKLVQVTSCSPTTANSAPEEPAVPDLLLQLPETVRQAVHGCVGGHGPVIGSERGSHVTIYISCADPSASAICKTGLSETVNERLRELKELAASRGASLQVVNDPWSGSLSSSPSSPTSCEDRLDRIALSNLNRLMETSHVIPVFIMGDSLGRTCLPLSVEEQDFQAALKQLENSGTAVSAEDRALVETWYLADSHSQPPCYRLQSTANMGEEVQQRLLDIFITVFSPELSDAYLTTLFEQEVHNSVCMSQELARRSVWVQELSPSLAGGTASPASSTSSDKVQRNKSSSTNSDTSITDRENRRRVNAVQKILRSLLQDKHMVKGQLESAEAAGQLLSTVLRSIIDDLLDEIEAKDSSARSAIPRPVLDEINQHLAFCQKAASCSVNRESALMAIKRYVTGNDRHPLIVHGAEGSGKTCLVARTAQQCHTWFQQHLVADPDAAEMGLILRFARLTPQSGSTLALLHSMTRQVSLLLTGRLPTVPHTLNDYRSVLHRLLDGERLSPNRRLTFIVDGLDHLEDFDSAALDLLRCWLPAQLPTNVKVLLTLRNGGRLLEELRAAGNLPDDAFYKLEELSPGEAHNLFDACLVQHAHSSHGEHLVAMAAQINQSHRPLTVKILSWQAGLAEEWRADGTGIGSTNGLLPCSTNIIPNLTAAVVELVGQCGSGKENPVGLMIAMISSSRYGLCDYEMEDLCQAHLSSKSCWPTLAHFVGPFLQRTLVGGLGLISWRDAILHQQMTATFLADRESSRVHRLMLDYYWPIWRNARASLESRKWADLATPTSAAVALRLARRALDGIPHHLSRLDPSTTLDEWRELWNDPAWLLSKLAVSGVTQVIEDATTLTSPAARPPQTLLQWLTLCAPALDYDYRQLAGQLMTHGALPADVPSVFPSLVTGLASNQASSPAANDEPQVFVSAIYRLNDEPSQAAALSAVSNEMSLWDFSSGKCFKVMSNMQYQPLKVAPLATDRCVVLCGRELRVYDIHTGDELLKLKGMMNQKLPLFGLHGDSHVVSLSRNRMYVNLISLENGDCVTTFKVGEDRFLNSLLVSDNGRVLVCGDESKRPCSLLVWDLQAKKLIYDLKMLHHEFITRLSAITGDGNYVACVCKELETADPNFIVVYDLQSGTLFKKWKPGANTVAVTIACQNSCVVTSLQDGRILIWDLGTGNCRWTLFGHTAAVDTLNLDAEGNYLLSWDSRDHDRSLRLWNLSNGHDVASFTPDRRTTAAQLSADGNTILIALAGRSDLVQLKLSSASTQSK